MNREKSDLIQTRAEGVMARFAHDLQLRVDRFEGQLHLEFDSDKWSATIRIAVEDLSVEGVLRGGSRQEWALLVGPKAHQGQDQRRSFPAPRCW